MSLEALFDDIAMQGVQMWVDNATLRYRAPKGALSPALLETIRSKRDEILAALGETGTLEPAFPLSYSQRVIWFAQQMVPQSAAYNVVFACRVDAAFDAGRWRAALTRLVARHPALRTIYGAGPDGPLQRVKPATTCEVELVDAAGLDASALERLVDGYRRAPLRLDTGPVFRVTAFEGGDGGYVFLFVVHHIACDGWSAWLLINELQELYRANGTEPPLPANVYRDFVSWERRRLDGPRGAQLAAYWARRLADAPSLMPLPAERAANGRSGGRSAGFTIDGELLAGLRRVAASRQSTLYGVLLAAFQTLLHRWTMAEDVVVTTPMLGRTHGHFEAVVGCFSNLVVLRERLTPETTFPELLKRGRTTVLEALEHEDYPFSLLVEALQPERDATGRAFAQVGFTYQQAQQSQATDAIGELLSAGGRGRWGELDVEPFPLSQQEGQFDLALEVFEGRTALSGSFKYLAELFGEATIRRLSAELRVLLEGIAADSGRALSAFPLLTPAERRQIVEEWNDTGLAYPRRCVHELVAEQAARTPAAVALVSGDERVTYAQLDARANRLAHHLAAQGVGPEVLVGLCLERSADMAVALLAILKAGGAFVPLDPNYPFERLLAIATDARLTLIVTRESLAARLPEGPRRVLVDADRAAVERCPATAPAARAGLDDLFCVLFTSGSTGRPKGVMLTHHGVTARMAWDTMTGPAEVYAQKTTLNFVDAIWELFMPLTRGLRTVMVPEAVIIDPPAFAALLERESVTCLVLVPSLLRVLLEAGDAVLDRLHAVRLWMSSGEPLPLDLAAAFGRQLPGCRLLNLYGTTECIDAAFHVVDPRRDTEIMPVGHVPPNARVYVLSGLEPVPVGALGEICVGGAYVARGYYDRPDLTAERFVASPFVPGDRLYRTGDLGRWRPDGILECVGRRDHQVKLRGYRIELGEIEAALRACDGVRQAVVVRHDGDGGEPLLAAYVVGAPDGDALREHLQTRLPHYMVPAAVVALDALPLMPNGKIDRRALPRPSGRNGSVARAPRTPREAALARIWADVLRLPEVGVADNFFDIGGHSLVAAKLVTRIRTELGVALELGTFLRSPTVAALAQAIDAGQPEAPEGSVTVLRPGGSADPIVCVHPIGGGTLCYRDLAARFHAGPTVYGVKSPPPVPGEAPTTIGAMADRYLAELRRAVPHGPYRFVSWSLGGLVALEMARRLTAAGERVAALVMIDTYYTTDAGRAVVAQSDLPMWQTFLAETFPRVAARVHADEAAFRALSDPERTDAVLRALAEDGDALERSDLEALVGVWRRNFGASVRYVPAPYDGELVVFEAAYDLDEGRGTLTNDWAPVARRLRTIRLPGTHAGIVRGANAATIAAFVDATYPEER